MNKQYLETILNELIAEQQAKLLHLGRRRIPCLTADDILQPNDFPELELDPLFRYEEGVLAGMLSVQATLRAESAIQVATE